MQKELNNFYQSLRLKLFFKNKSDARTEKFYQKSEWEPPKACLGIEKLIDEVQSKFDS